MQNAQHTIRNTGIGAAVALFLACGGIAHATDNSGKYSPNSAGQGTSEEQDACAPDATKYCKDAIPDTFKVLACLQEHRKRLKKACREVLKSHGVLKPPDQQ
jgi:hypothetical protein